MRSASATITLPCEPHERGWRGQRLTATQVVYTCHVYRDREPILQASYLTADLTYAGSTDGTDGWPARIVTAMTEYIDAWNGVVAP